MGPIGLADKKSLGRPTRRLSRHPMGDQDSRHQMYEPRLQAASIGAQPGKLSPTSDTRSRLNGVRWVSLAMRVGRKKNPGWEGCRSIRCEIETQDNEWVSLARRGGGEMRVLVERVRTVFGGAGGWGETRGVEQLGLAIHLTET